MRILFAISLSFLAAGLALAQKPVIASGGIGNTGNFQASEGIAPGSLFAIFGTNLASTAASASSVPFGSNLAGVTVRFVNGSTTINAPMNLTQPATASSQSFVFAQVPWELASMAATPTTINVIVSNNGVDSDPTPVQIGPYAPGLYALNGRAVAVNFPDGSLAWPDGTGNGYPTRPAHPGDTIILYAAGLGAVSTPPVDGGVPPAAGPYPTTNTMPTILIGGMSAQVSYSGLSQYVGVNQLNVVVPTNAPTGSSVSVQISVGGVTTDPSLATMAVGN